MPVRQSRSAALARISGIDLPLVAGSDLSASLFKEVIKEGDRIAVVGATPEFLDRLRTRFPTVEFLHHAPPMGLRANAKARREAAAFLASADARFSFITVGSPQQEMIANEARVFPGATGIALCVGAALEFLTGDQKRAPRRLRQLGFEWAHRLATNPKRLWRRYLVEGPRIIPIYFAWTLRERRKWWAAAAVMLVAAIAAALMLRASPGIWLDARQAKLTRAPPGSRRTHRCRSTSPRPTCCGPCRQRKRPSRMPSGPS